jgi:hypothetical protein
MHLLCVLDLENKLRRADLARLQVRKSFLDAAKSAGDDCVWVSSEPALLQTLGEEAEIAMDTSVVHRKWV